MTPRLPMISGAEAIQALGRAGFDQVSQRGSHIKLRNFEGRTVLVPLHHELARGTLRSILGNPVLPRKSFDHTSDWELEQPR